MLLPIVCYTQSVSDHVLQQSYVPLTFVSFFLASLEVGDFDKPRFLEEEIGKMKFVSYIHFLLPALRVQCPTQFSSYDSIPESTIFILSENQIRVLSWC